MKREGMDTEKSLKKTIWRFMVILCLIVFAVSVFGIVGTLLKANREKSTFDDLIEMAEADVGAEQGNIDSDAAAEMETTEASEAGQTNSDHTGGVMEEKPKRNYGLLKEKNPDFAGWLRIPDTKIDYPVMHTPDDMQYYIRRDFYGESSVSGTPFIGDFCSIDSGSMIIYAHNMKNGTMFGELDEYESEDYRNKHSVLEFYTPDESRQYEIFAAFRTELVYENQEGFRYYEYVGDMTEERFDEFMNQLRQHSFYDTESWPEYGDQLIILSTCSYYTENGRFVVVARRVE